MAEFTSLSFNKMLAAVHKTKKVVPFEGLMIALDPGETTGYSVWEGKKESATLLNQGQLKTWPMVDSVREFNALFQDIQPNHVVHEIYAVYEWKTDDHAWSQIPTVRVIGCIETLCILKGIPYSSQTAQVAKNWVSDEKLKGWGFYAVGQRHARDSVRHGTYYLLFRPT